MTKGSGRASRFAEDDPGIDEEESFAWLKTAVPDFLKHYEG